ncbi:hypothetical protein GMRT_13551 [Giardia muris]|uniref:Uncharacterized protein n=1 Tax=Giardia muris TaxID=5742 RepID=A0A4Z1TBS0_GIAMU|nr:hypothetical protein GMRT_13551 [Giardia muris]|eukprot:TNJ29971.1 hypothetical protein GMRT_13551 [Giardia muris]
MSRPSSAFVARSVASTAQARGTMSVSRNADTRQTARQTRRITSVTGSNRPEHASSVQKNMALVAQFLQQNEDPATAGPISVQSMKTFCEVQNRIIQCLRLGVPPMKAVSGKHNEIWAELMQTVGLIDPTLPAAFGFKASELSNITQNRVLCKYQALLGAEAAIGLYIQSVREHFDQYTGLGDFQGTDDYPMYMDDRTYPLTGVSNPQPKKSIVARVLDSPDVEAQLSSGPFLGYLIRKYKAFLGDKDHGGDKVIAEIRDEINKEAETNRNEYLKRKMEHDTTWRECCTMLESLFSNIHYILSAIEKTPVVGDNATSAFFDGVYSILERSLLIRSRTDVTPQNYNIQLPDDYFSVLARDAQTSHNILQLHETAEHLSALYLKRLRDSTDSVLKFTNSTQQPHKHEINSERAEVTARYEELQKEDALAQKELADVREQVKRHQGPSVHEYTKLKGRLSQLRNEVEDLEKRIEDRQAEALERQAYLSSLRLNVADLSHQYETAYNTSKYARSYLESLDQASTFGEHDHDVPEPDTNRTINLTTSQTINLAVASDGRPTMSSKFYVQKTTRVLQTALNDLEGKMAELEDAKVRELTRSSELTKNVSSLQAEQLQLEERLLVYKDRDRLDREAQGQLASEMNAKLASVSRELNQINNDIHSFNLQLIDLTSQENMRNRAIAELVERQQQALDDTVRTCGQVASLIATFRQLSREKLSMLRFKLSEMSGIIKSSGPRIQEACRLVSKLESAIAEK